MTSKVVTVITFTNLSQEQSFMRILSCDGLTVLSPFSSKIDHHQSSTCNTYALENGVVMRIMDMITQIL